MGFMQSQPNIYKQMQLGGKIKEWDSNDMWTLFSPLLQKGYNWDPKDGVLKVSGGTTFTAQTPWVHQDHISCKQCNLDHSVTFNTWNIIHPRCMECWKVVVTPTTFVELLQLEELEKGMTRPSKCGIELRDYTPKFYGGYFYNGSLDEGRECFEVVRDAVRKQINKKVADTVILKRACTEYEMVKGPSPFWHNTKDEERMIKLIDTFVEAPKGNTGQNNIVKNHVRLKWALWAHMNNDMTYQDFNGGKSLFPGYVKYHEGDINDIKHDIACARAHAKAGIDPEKSDEFLKFADEFAKKYSLQTTDLIHSLGGHESNPLGAFDIIRNVPEEVKGEQDEYV